jgi:hypothetical protein
VVGAKAFAAKALIGASVLVGSAATGYATFKEMPANYMDGISELIDNAVATEGLGAAPERSEMYSPNFAAASTTGPK